MPPTGSPLVKSDWVNGNLVFQDLSGNTLLTISRSRVNQLDEYPLVGHIPNAQASGVVYIPIPHSGTIANIQLVSPQGASAVLGFTAFVSTTSLITHAALQLASGAAADAVAEVAPTANNTVSAGKTVLVRSNGNVVDATTVTVVLTVRRG